MLRRALALAMTMFVTVVASIVWAVATPAPAGAAVGGGVLKAPGGACSTEEWQQDFKSCVGRLADVSAAASSALVRKPTSSSTAGMFAPTSTRNGSRAVGVG